MKWLITGGSGQLGLAMQTELSSRGIDFFTVNSSELDITKSSMVNQLVDYIKPGIIINTAAWTDVDGAESNKTASYSVNALGPQNLAIAAGRFGARMVQVSTDYVFSGNNSAPWQENAAHNPQSIYGLTKSQGEIFTQATLPLDSYVVRTAWLYSAVRKNFAKTMTNLALHSVGSINVVNDQFGQPTFAGDLAKQIVDLVISNAPVGVYHGTNSGNGTWFEFAKDIFKLAGADVSRVVPVSTSELPKLAKRPSYSILGHDAWSHTNIPIMRNWRTALAEAMPSIISAVNSKG